MEGVREDVRAMGMSALMRAKIAGAVLAAAAMILIPAVSAQAAPRNPVQISSSALTWAEQHTKGLSYSWGGAGPYSYDCSGLVSTALRHEGVYLPHYTVGMVHSGKLYRVYHPRRGDLAFWGSPGYPYHVEFYVGHGYTYGARTYGEPIGFHKISPWFSPSSYWRIR
jgi:cell wall-associated NlpC family hydrolase